METFNRFSIVVAALLRASAIGIGGLSIGCWFIGACGIVDSRGYDLPVFALMVTAVICAAIELATAYYLSFVPMYVEPPKPIGWRPPQEERRDTHDSPWQ